MSWLSLAYISSERPFVATNSPKLLHYDVWAPTLTYLDTFA